MKWKLNIPESHMLLYYWGKFNGLVPFNVIDKKFYPPTKLSTFYKIVFISSYSFIASQTFMNLVLTAKMDKNYLPALMNWVLFNGITRSAVVTSSLIIFSMKYKKIIYLMNKLCYINGEMKSFGIVDNSGKFFKNMFVAVVMVNFGRIATSIIVIYNYAVLSVFIVLKTTIDSLLVSNLLLIFVGMLVNVTQSLRLLNKKSYDIFPPDRRQSLQYESRIFRESRNNLTENETDNNKCLTDFQCIRQLHLELCDLIELVNHLFEIPIMLEIIRCSTLLIACIFWFVSLTEISDQTRVNFWNMIFPPLVEIIATIVELFIIAYASTTISREANATKAVLSRVWNNSQQRELKNEIFLFSTQLLHQPVVVSLFGFYRLDYSFLLEVFCTVLMYVIVTLQFDPRWKTNGL